MAAFKVAVIGAGILGSRHARVFNEHARCNTVAIIDLNQTRARDVAEPLGARCFSSLEAALEIDFDLLVVATPDHLHRDPIVTAVSHGKHVFVEKPLATSLEDAEAIVAATAANKSVVMVNFSQRYMPEFAAIKQLIEAGEIGTPAMVLSNKFNTIHVPTRMIGWADSTSPFLFMSSHDLDLVHWYVGADPSEVVARERRGILDAAGIHVHDGLNVLMQFGDSISANFHASWVHPNSFPGLGDGFMQIIGSEGMLTMENRQRRLVVHGAKRSYEQKFSGYRTVEEVDGRLIGAFADSVDVFVDCVEAAREPDTSPRLNLPVAKAQFAALASIKSGKAIRVGNE